MERILGAAAPLPAFLSVVVTRLANISEVLQVMTLAFGCAVSGVMLVSWYFKARREHAADKLAELKLKEAEDAARQTITDASEVAQKRLAEAEAIARKTIEAAETLSKMKVCPFNHTQV